MVAANPNWPLVHVDADFTAGPPAVPGINRRSLNLANGLAVWSLGTHRGRQYELGQCEAGTATLTVADPKEVLNPGNSGSPFMTGGNTILPNRGLQIWALWNTATGGVTGNILNSGNQAPGQPTIGAAYGYDPSFENWSTSGLVVSNDGTTTSPVTTPPDGTYAVTKVVANSATSSVGWIPRIVGGGSYTLSVDVYATTGVTVTASYGSTSAVTTSTGVYQTLTMPVTAANSTNWQLKATTASTYPATFYFANIRITGLMPGWSQTAGSAMSYTPAQAHSGAYSLGTTMQAATDTMSLPVPTAPGITYTLSSWVYAVGAGSVVRMSVGGATASSSAVGAWQRLIVTFVATDAVATVTWAAPSGTFPVTFYVDDDQFEASATASTYTASGPTAKPLHTGYVERWPQTWAMQGSRGIKPLESVDALSVLSRTSINQSYAATIAVDNPAVYLPYADQAAPTTVQRPTGGAAMTGYTNLGANGSPSVNYGGDTFLDGSRALSVVQQNANPPISGDVTYVTYAGTRGGALSMNTQSFTIECWVRFVAGTTYFGAASVQPGENTNTEAAGPQYYIGWYTSAGALYAWYSDPNGSGSIYYALGGWNGYPDGQWHYLSIIFTGAGKFTYWIDGGYYGNVSTSGTLSPTVSLNNFFVEATTAFGGPMTNVSVANMAAYSTALSINQTLNHYRRGFGYVNEFPGNRVKRLLNQYWGSTYTVAIGTMHLAPDFYWNPVSTGGQSSSMSVLQAIQDIVVSENGLFYVNAAGTLVFEDRVSRYQNQTSLWTFGENTAGGELPYENLEYDFDATYMYSQVNLSRPGNNSFPPMPNPPPANPPAGQRILPKQLQANTDYDLQQAGIFYLNRYALPKQRIRKMTISPAKNPSMFTAALSLEISNRITVKRRTTAGVTIAGDYYVESIAHHINAAEGEWTVDLELSPVFVPTAWVLGDATYGVLGSTTVPVY